MKYRQDNASFVLILERGEELIESLNNFAKAEQLTSGWLASGVGGANQATLAFYDFEAKQYNYRDFEQGLEILSLQGNLSWVDDEPFWHVHAVLSGEDFKSIGGHVKSMTISLTGEILITKLDTHLTRLYDKTTGLKLLATNYERQGDQ